MKTIIVTGASSGIGLAVCQELIEAGYRVIGIGRNRERCAAAKQALGVACCFFTADLMHQAEVKRVAGELSAYLDSNCEGKLYALINNAGCVRSWYATTEDGYEEQFALNHLAGFLLTHYLLKHLQAAQGRVLMTSSRSHNNLKMRWDDLMFKKGYHPLLAYKQSKLCNMLFAYAFNARFADTGVRAFGVDPGLVKTDIGLKDTGGLVSFVWSQRMKGGVDPCIPAKTYAWICDQEKTPTGLYYYRCTEKRYSKEICRENADRLFAISEKLCGIEFGRNELCMQ
jgi:NAD(P)-dependent dehydrogenase (short-subunit alcohol dehydrogenase family)